MSGQISIPPCSFCNYASADTVDGLCNVCNRHRTLWRSVGGGEDDNHRPRPIAVSAMPTHGYGRPDHPSTPVYPSIQEAQVLPAPPESERLAGPKNSWVKEMIWDIQSELSETLSSNDIEGLQDRSHLLLDLLTPLWKSEIISEDEMAELQFFIGLLLDNIHQNVQRDIPWHVRYLQMRLQGIALVVHLRTPNLTQIFRCADFRQMQHPDQAWSSISRVFIDLLIQLLPAESSREDINSKIVVQLCHQFTSVPRRWLQISNVRRRLARMVTHRSDDKVTDDHAQMSYSDPLLEIARDAAEMQHFFEDVQVSLVNSLHSRFCRLQELQTYERISVRLALKRSGILTMVMRFLTNKNIRCDLTELRRLEANPLNAVLARAIGRLSATQHDV